MNRQFDLIVVGAGVLGTLHAWHAAAIGKKVLLLEKDHRPVNASVRNFGMAIVSGMAGRWFEYGRYSTALYKEIQQEYDISVRNNGSLYIASDDDEQQLLHELKEHYDQIGYEAQLLSRQQVQEKVPAIRSSYCREGLFFPQEISLEPDQFIHRLHQYTVLKYAHVTYQPATPAIDCVVEGDGVSVTVAGGEKFRAEKAVIASGHEFRILFPSLFAQEDLSLVKLQMLRSLSFPDLQMEGNIATGLSIRRYESFAECPSYSSITTPDHLRELAKWGIHILFKKATDGTVIVGDSHEYARIGEEENLGYAINQQINELIRREASRIADIDLGQVKETWAGFYAVHNTKEVLEHDIENRIFIRVAIGGKGMTCAAGYAQANIEKIFACA
jgi:FAD dependent oxidoreductase TIGR03364